MAPVVPLDAPMLKRSSSTAGLDVPPSKKQLHHHGLKWRQDLPDHFEPPLQDGEAVHSLLTRALGLALEAVGFEGAEPIAMESFRALAEEYMVNFLVSVRKSMLSSRRSQTIPQDYLQALHENHITLSALILHLDPPVPPEKSQPLLASESALEEGQSAFFPSFKPILDAKPNSQSSPYIPRHFPTLPGEHTYRTTWDEVTREKDPRKIRERATEEGRLGEEALRRLVGTGTRRTEKGGSMRQNTEDLRKRRKELWESTMDALTQDTGVLPDSSHNINGGAIENLLTSPFASPKKQHLTSAVNAEKTYWRKGSRS